MLLDAHIVLHLHNGEVWSTLQNVPTDHGEVVSQCLIHLVYLGRGLYIELTRQETPLVVVPLNITAMPNVESLVVGELTVAETQTSNQTLESDPANIDTPLNLSTEKISFTQYEPETAVDLSLTKENRAPPSSDITQHNDLALNLTSSVQGQDAHPDPRPLTSDATCDDINIEKTLPELTLSMTDVSGDVKNKEETSPIAPSKKCNRIVKVMLKRLTMDNDKQQILVNQAQLDAMPKSKYRKDWDDYYQQDCDSDDPVPELL